MDKVHCIGKIAPCFQIATTGKYVEIPVRIPDLDADLPKSRVDGFNFNRIVSPVGFGDNQYFLLVQAHFDCFFKLLPPESRTDHFTVTFVKFRFCSGVDQQQPKTQDPKVLRATSGAFFRGREKTGMPITERGRLRSLGRYATGR
ncbi:hypothetical protein [Duganella rhizosphaerae]|uniref:hypothetical protein n=1 Tax=Duganella rhizosphaerae TaxID=2885763 RepID=UPI00403F9CDF